MGILYKKTMRGRLGERVKGERGNGRKKEAILSDGPFISIYFYLFLITIYSQVSKSLFDPQ